MTYANESERLQRVERLQDIKQALKRGISTEKRAELRERLADIYLDWLRRKMDRGADPIQVLPELAAEIQLRAEEAAVQAVRELKSELIKALK